MTSRKVKGFLHGALRGIISSKISWSISHKTAFHSIHVHIVHNTASGQTAMS